MFYFTSTQRWCSGQEMRNNFNGETQCNTRENTNMTPNAVTIAFPPLSTLNITREIYLVRELSDVHLKPLLNLIQSLGVRLIRYEGDGQTLGTKPASSCYSM